MQISRLTITAAASCTVAIAPTPLTARPTTPTEAPQACQVITQKDIENVGRTSVAEALQKIPTSPVDCPPPTSNSISLDPFNQRILDIHNQERALVGAAPLRWNPVLAQHATEEAQVLADTGQLVHADRAGRGIERENLQKGLIGWSPDYFVRDWRLEKRLFRNGLFPNVCDGDWSQCAHYSQMIWPTTTDIGCGRARGLGFDWFVCRYSPGGNKDGKPVGRPVVAAGLSTGTSATNQGSSYAKQASGYVPFTPNTSYPSRSGFNTRDPINDSVYAPAQEAAKSANQPTPVPPNMDLVKDITPEPRNVETPPPLPPTEVVTGSSGKVEPPNLPPAEVVNPRTPNASAPQTLHDRLDPAQQALNDKVNKCEPIDITEYSALDHDAIMDAAKRAAAIKSARGTVRRSIPNN